MNKILVVDDEKTIRLVLKKFLNSIGYEVEEADSAESALKLADGQEFFLAFVDVKLPDASGLELIEKLKGIPVVIMTAYGDVEVAVRSMEMGAVDYLTKPFSLEEVRRIVERLSKESQVLSSSSELPEIVGKSKKMQEIFKLVGRIAKSNVPVLITGESGTGKEVIARAIHKYSGRKGKFVAVNCASLPENLLEAELFGYEKGAFTGAVSRKKGLFEEANHGTIFLDEIAELPLKLQAKLLRVLQDGEVRRLGSVNPVKVDVRVISATNKNIREEVNSGRFREDLFYRINVVEINVPPLRERKEDIIPLALYFIKHFSREFKLPEKKLSKEAVRWLTEYTFPGNVRELKNMIGRAVLLSPDTTIRIEDLNPSEPSLNKQSFADTIRQFVLEVCSVEQKERNNIYQLVIRTAEKVLIEEVLRICNYNQKKASMILGIHRNTLRRKLKELGIKTR
jgi:two-component system nitrogen regulation response regulator GlnG